VVRRVYGEIHSLLRPGGILVNLDWMPVADAPLLAAIAESSLKSRDLPIAGLGEGPSWASWWAAVAAEPGFAGDLEKRARLPNLRSAEFIPSVAWHRGALLATGFSEVAEMWRDLSSAVLAAVR
jgi:hypothetical protein